jgi:hypothetical protein
VVRQSNEKAKQDDEATTLTIWVRPWLSYNPMITKLPQIFGPIGLVATIFNMSQDIVPFKMNFGSFIISYLVTMAVELLFLWSSRKPRWKKIAASMKTLHLSEIGHRFWTGEYSVRFIMRRFRRNNDNRATEEGVESPTSVGVQQLA